MTDERAMAGADGEGDGRSAFVESFASLFAAAGMPRMPSRVFVALLACESGRLTAAELAELLVASPAAISGAVGYLVQVNMITRERAPGARRDHYVVQDDAWYEAVLNRDSVVRAWIQALDTGVETFGLHSRAGRRLAVSRAFLAFMLEQFPSWLERWEIERQALIASWDAELDVPSGT